MDHSYRGLMVTIRAVLGYHQGDSPFPLDLYELQIGESGERSVPHQSLSEDILEVLDDHTKAFPTEIQRTQAPDRMG